MCIEANFDDYGMSVFVCLMRGDYDSRLMWPFRGHISIQLVNHSNDEYQREWTVNFSDPPCISCCW